jgi:hypothetical protein
MLTSAQTTKASLVSAPELQWSKTYGYIAAYGITQASDGNLLVATVQANGYAYTGHLGFYYTGTHGALLKIDLDGNVLSNKTLPFLPTVMNPTINRDVIVVGETETFYGYTKTDESEFPISQHFASLAKLSEDGETVWSKTYNLPGQPIPNLNETAYCAWDVGAHAKFLLQLSDGGYLFGGYAVFGGSLGDPLGDKAWLIRTDSTGNSLWAKTYGNDENYDSGRYNSANSAVQTPDGGFLFVGAVDGCGLVKIDALGNIEWTNEPADFSNAAFRSVLSTEDKGYLLAGYKN